MQYCVIIIARYPKWLGWAGFFSMAIFRFPLWLDKKINFWKLMGCGKNASFSKVPDWRQWSLLYTFANNGELQFSEQELQQKMPFIYAYWKFFRCETVSFVLKPVEGHGTWDGKQPMGNLPKQSSYEGMIGVLTRATIRLNKLKQFWQHVDGVSNSMSMADGFIVSFGIGEVPWIKQATFSIWQSKQQMKGFAYNMREHKEVVQKTRKENWYSEDMFVRFEVLASYGCINGNNPLKRIP